MTKRITHIALILIAAHLVGLIPSVLGAKVPALVDLRISPFWASEEEMPILWFMKYLIDQVFVVLLMFSLSRLSYLISIRLYRLCLMLFFYQVFDLCMLLYDFKRSYSSYWVILGIIVSISAFILYPEKRKPKAIIKTMEL